MPTPPPPYRLSNDTVWVLWNGVPHEIDSTQPNYAPLRTAVLSAIMTEDWSDVPNHFSVAEAIMEWADGAFEIIDGAVHCKGKRLPDVLNDRVLKMVSRKDDPRPLLRAWERLAGNPEQRSREQLFDFLRQNPGIAFTDDGYILFYKGVRKDFRDSHSGKFDNSPGQSLYMDRARVSSDPNTACSFGFHVGARAYASNFGAQVIIVKVDPADVVCVPNDCSQQKIRIHRYTVIGVDNGGLLPDTNFDGEPEAPVPTKATDPVTGEPPVDPSEPLVAPADPALDAPAEPAEATSHTDGSALRSGETTPLPADADTAVSLPLTGTEWDYMNDLDSLELLKLRIMPVRAYARFNCLIIGASKMRGGKAVLIPAIIKARGYADPAERDDN